MPAFWYQVMLATPLGPRHGMMKLDVCGEKADGWLRLLGHQESISGKVMADGFCQLTGKISTFMRSIDYTAEGQLQEDKVQLKLHAKRNEFLLSGTSCPPGEETNR